MGHSLAGIIVLTTIGLSCCMDKINQGLVITNVDRSVDITSQVIKTVSKISVVNNDNSPVDYFLYSVEPGIEKHVSYIGAYARNRQMSLKISEASVEGVDGSLRRVDFPKSLKPAAKIEIEVEVYLTNSIIPFPSSIDQKNRQLVLYDGNALLYIPYSVLKQTTTILTGTKGVESVTQLKPFQQSNEKVVYGPFENITPFAVKQVSVHYENNSPFLSVRNLERVIEISHWGNIAVEEDISLEHRGATLKGPFSRVDPLGPATVKWFETVLPAAARDVYYRDDIGNVSTSNLRVLSDSVHVKLQPRFPIVGGWKTKYTLGYNIPTYEVLYNSGENYILKMRILDHIFDDMVVDNLTTKIILPEGAENIAVKTPYPVDRLPDERHFTYLDTIGRKVVVLRMKNLVENHIKDLEVAYTLPAQFLLHKPLLLVFGVYSLLVAAIFVKRLDLSLSPTAKST